MSRHHQTPWLSSRGAEGPWLPRAVGSAALVLTLLAATATPSRANNEISLRLSSLHTIDDGVDAFSTKPQLLAAELSYARALTGPQRGLWAEIAWTISGASAPLFGEQLKAQGTFHTLTVGARITWPLWSWLVPQARAGLGLAIGRVSIDGTANGVDPVVSDTAFGLSAYALVGVQLLLPQRWMRHEERSGFTVGLVIEGGLLLTTPMSFHLTPEADKDRRVIPSVGVAIGDITLTSAIVRAGFLMRF